MILFFSVYLSKHRDELKNVWKGFLKPIIYFLAPPIGILLLVQSHFSASVIIILVVSVMMITAGSRFSHFAVFGSLGARRTSWWNVYFSKILPYRKL